MIKRTLLLLLLLPYLAFAKTYELLNVSYDPTRELYKQVNKLFAKEVKEKTGDKVIIRQSHGGSGKQARAVIEGLQADVVTLALAHDIDVIAERTGKLSEKWQNLLPYNSSPYHSTIVFLVRKGNPKNIKDWDDLFERDIKIMTPNPKTSGAARWNYLAAYAYADRKYSGDDSEIRNSLAKLFKKVPILDVGARGSAINFVRRNIGDVLITWENEAYLAIKEFGNDKFDMIVPSISVKAEPPVAVVSQIAEKNGNSRIAKEYLEFLYRDEIQRIIIDNHFRSVDSRLWGDKFANIKMVTINDFGGWHKVHQEHFAGGGVFDQIYKPV